MSNGFKAVQLTDTVFWVGAIDWSIRDFHGYSTNRGTTYNAYLILADKITLIDTVKKPFWEEFVSRIKSVVDPSKIEVVVSHHSEFDHSGCLPEILNMAHPSEFYASKMGIKALQEHFNWDQEVIAVKNGETVDLGGKHLTFLETRMLHWPDSMISYLSEDRMLFSQDAFGMHLATGERFADEVDSSVVESEMAKYYANILLPYSKLIPNLLGAITKQGWAIDWIAHDHGPIIRKDIPIYLERYTRWAEQAPEKKAVIIYDTMWGSTALMAKAITDGLLCQGIRVKQMPLSGSHRSDVATEILDAGALIVGSPTINNQLFPSIADVLTYLKGLKPQNLSGAAFGSYGWGGEATGAIKNFLESMGVNVIAEKKVKYVPNGMDLKDCFRLGETIAAAIKEM